MRPLSTRPTTRRRGLTLIEMLVTVALLLLIMTVIVSIFQSATGAITVSRAYQELDQHLRRLEATIRQDLGGATARFTPPLNPNDGLGYFEYGENAFADRQGEDTDDYIAGTFKAPEGQPFIGRVWVNSGAVGIQPIMVTSQFAEITYFLRNGNLYRRVLLIAPERQGTVGIGPVDPAKNLYGATPGTFGTPGTSLFGGSVSWQGMNDLSARPATSGSTLEPILTTLGDLTNRENRFARPRFTNDFVNNLTGKAPPDGLPDDQNPNGGNGVPDYYPTLYSNAILIGGLNELVPPNNPVRTLTHEALPFPFIFPGAYSKLDPSAGTSPAQYGPLHFQGPGTTLTTINHAPLDLGDNLPIPVPGKDQEQTWWGFPTWRETLLAAWTDPVKPVVYGPSYGLSWPSTPTISLPSPLPLSPQLTQPFHDRAGNAAFAPPGGSWQGVWEEDLIMTGVRSFDVKAFDFYARDYVDLGFDPDPSVLYDPVLQGAHVHGFPKAKARADAALLGFGHEGRIPPHPDDWRSDPQWPLLNPNIGDPGTNVIRLRRVWDSWSTDYTNAPDVPLDPTQGAPFARPTYPSYPPPYPAALRGIQIQVRVVDPRNEHIKVMTVRQDFSNKL